VRKNWKIWLGVVISVAFLTLALRGLNFDNFWDALREANYAWIIPGALIYFGAVLARTWRWHYMLRHIKPVPLRRLFPIVVIGYMGNNVYPARAGEVIRSYMLKQKEGISMGASLTTVILERLFDGLVMSRLARPTRRW
jgi:glycosyltransferase 2 family protein